MKPNCYVIWELELCDCGSVNNKLFKNIVLRFMPLCDNTLIPFGSTCKVNVSINNAPD